MTVETRRYKDFLELMEERYSVRSYSDRPVEDEKLQRILRAGQVAPTGCNFRPQRFYVLRSEEGLKKVDELTPCRYGAPCVMLLAYNIDECYHYGQEEGFDSGCQDVAIVATHMMLEAAELGLGTCWVNNMPPTRSEQAFGLPENEQAVMFLPLGYAAEDAAPSPRHEASKPLEALVKYC